MSTTTAEKPRSTKKVAATPAARSLRKTNQSEIWKTYSKGGPGSAIENQIVEQYLPLVKSIVGRLAMTLPTHVAMDDLYSAGLVGLLNAIRRYDVAGGSSFEAYARVRVRGSIFDELRRAHWLPRSVHDKSRRVEAAMQRLEQQKGEVPTDEELAKELNLNDKEFNKLMNEIKPATFVCLDSVKGQDDEHGDNQHAMIPDPSQPDPCDKTAKQELSGIIAERLEHLPEMQRKVLALYYFEDLRLREIAEVFGVTESRICQIHTKAIMAIRTYLHKNAFITAEL